MSLSAKTPKELTRACFKNNLIHNMEFDYFQVIFTGKEWIAFFHGDISLVQSEVSDVASK